MYSASLFARFCLSGVFHSYRDVLTVSNIVPVLVRLSALSRLSPPEAKGLRGKKTPELLFYTGLHYAKNIFQMYFNLWTVEVSRVLM